MDGARAYVCVCVRACVRVCEWGGAGRPGGGGVGGGGEWGLTVDAFFIKN